MNNWRDFLENEFEKPYFIALNKRLDEEYQNYIIYPKRDLIFNAFELCDLNNLKVVLIGQDPYHEPNQAHGLAFSVLNGNKMPPSLRNLYLELSNDLNIEMPKKTDLSTITKEGVLLLNTILTVRKGEALSHKDLGWEEFTINVIKYINNLDKPIVYILLGNHAFKYEQYLNNPKQLIIKAPHPSPLSAHRGFFGSKIFSRTNNFLIKNNVDPINWNILNN